VVSWRRLHLADWHACAALAQLMALAELLPRASRLLRSALRCLNDEKYRFRWRRHALFMGDLRRGGGEGKASWHVAPEPPSAKRQGSVAIHLFSRDGDV